MFLSEIELISYIALTQFFAFGLFHQRGLLLHASFFLFKNRRVIING